MLEVADLKNTKCHNYYLFQVYRTTLLLSISIQYLQVIRINPILLLKVHPKQIRRLDPRIPLR